MARTTSFVLAVFFLVFSVVTDARGQSFQGGLRGAVRDSSGVVPAATVTLTNEGTTIPRETVSNDVGEYVFTSVVPGTYTVRAALAGFKTSEKKGIVIGTQQFITLDLVLEVGSITEQVTVVASAPLIDTSNASTGQVLNKEVLESLPSGGRIAFFMAETVPAVVPAGNPVMNRFQDQGTQSSVSLGGGPAAGNNYLLDGVSITDLTNRPVAAPSIEALGEVKVQVHTYDAEMGRTGGGVYNSTGRSGTNQWHGAFFAQNRPKWGAANDYYNEKAGIPVPAVSYLSLGASGGGPIVKGRTFFWATTENNRLDAQRTGVMTMPTAAMKNGDFSQVFDSQGRLVVIYDPLTTRPNPNGSGSIRDPFPGNIIPAGRINTVSRNLLQYFPAPDGGRGGVGNFVRTAILANKADQVTMKIDHRVNDKWSLSGMYLYQTTTEPAGAYYGGSVAEPADGYLVRPVNIVAINSTFFPSANSVVTLRYGFTRLGDNQVSPSTDAFDPAQLGFSSTFLKDIYVKKFPSILVAGYGEQVPQDQTGGGAILGDASRADRHYDSHIVSGTWAKFVGTHNIKAGGDYRLLKGNLLVYGQNSGVFNFSQSFTQGPNPNVGGSNAGDAFASFLLGYPSAGSATIPTPYNIFTRYYAAYAQDDYRVTSKLTLNFGLRYEYEAGLKEQNLHQVVGFDRNAVSPLNGVVPGLNLKGGLMFAGVNGAPDHQQDPGKYGFAPRVGFAWSLPHASVLRGGYGRYYVPGPYSNNPNVGALGFNPLTQYFVSADGGLTPAGTLGNPFPTGLTLPQGSSQGLLTGTGGDIAFVEQSNTSGYVHQYSFEYQRELPGAIAITVGYVGSRSENLSLGGVNINQLDPKYLSLGSSLQDAVPNPFYGIPAAGGLSASKTIARGQLLRPYPQFLNVTATNVSQGIVRYNALVLQVERRMSKGVGFRVAYTRSSRWDNLFSQDNYYARQSGTLGPENYYDLASEYSRSILDTPNRVNITAMFELPFGKGKRFLSASRTADAIVGGWQVTMIGMYQSGFPTPIMQSNNNSGLFGSGQRPNLVPGVSLTTDGSTIDRLNGWYNPAAFTAAAPFTFGNAPRTLDDARTPPLKNVDLAIEKRVSLFGSAKGVFRLEMFDALNFLNFRGPDTRFGLSTFGRITQETGNNRQVQMTFRVTF